MSLSSHHEEFETKMQMVSYNPWWASSAPLSQSRDSTNQRLDGRIKRITKYPSQTELNEVMR